MEEQTTDPYRDYFGDQADVAKQLLQSRVGAYSLMSLRFYRLRKWPKTTTLLLPLLPIYILIFVAIGWLIYLAADQIEQYLFDTILRNQWPFDDEEVLWIMSPFYVLSVLSCRLRGPDRKPDRPPVFRPPAKSIREAAKDAFKNDPEFRKAKLIAHSCLFCGYDLRANTGDRCAECGKAILGRASQFDVMDDIRAN